MGNAAAPTPASQGDSRAYKRSWKNLLINKQVQLRFTLFMVGLSALLMTLLGIWVKRVADNTTEVVLARVRGEPCPPLPDDGKAGPLGAATAVEPASEPATGAPAQAGAPAAAPGAEPAVDPDVDPSVPTEVTEAAPAAPTEAAAPPGAALAGTPDAPAPAPAPAPSVDGAAAGDRPRARVQVDESSMTMTAPPAEVREQTLAHWECEMRQAGLVRDLEARRRNIVWVLFASGILLCAGLAIYGIKMTHRVAGPLHKISLYFAKMREGRYVPVYPLRKGDELTEFYEHFKAAHAGVRRAEEADLVRMRAVIEASGRGPHDPELTKALSELQAAIERKEKSLE